MAVEVVIVEEGAEGATITVESHIIPILEQKSLVFKERLENPRPSISVDHSVGVDRASAEYVLNNLASETAESDENPHDAAGLSGVSNALWHFRCEPRGFSGLYDRLHQPWKLPARPESTEALAPALPAPANGALPPISKEWQWRLPRHSSRDLWPYYANAAWVLGKKKEEGFAEAIKSIAFDSIPRPFPTAVEELKHLKSERERLMKSVFETLLQCLTRLTHIANTREIGHEIQSKIQASRKLRIETAPVISTENRIVTAWEQSQARLADLTIYEFVFQLDLVLLKGTRMEYKGWRPPPHPLGEVEHQLGGVPVDDNAPVGSSPKAPPMILFLHMIRDIFHTDRKGPYEEVLKELFDTINAHIISDQNELVERLLGERDRGLQNLREALAREEQRRAEETHLQNGSARYGGSSRQNGAFGRRVDD